MAEVLFGESDHHNSAPKRCTTFVSLFSPPVNLTCAPHSIRSPLFGGPGSRLSFFNKIALPAQIGAATPFCYRSPNAIAPAQTLVAFLISVETRVRRLARPDWLRADGALHALLGIGRYPCMDTAGNFFRRFNQGRIQAFRRPMFRFLLSLVWLVLNIAGNR